MKKVANLRVKGCNEWDTHLINYWFIEEDAAAILAMSWPSFDYEDKLIWKANNKGLFRLKVVTWLILLREGLETFPTVGKSCGI